MYVIKHKLWIVIYYINVYELVRIFMKLIIGYQNNIVQNYVNTKPTSKRKNKIYVI